VAEIRNGGASQREHLAKQTTLAAFDPGVDQAQFSVFLARNMERDLVRFENRRDLRRFLQGRLVS
jgi:hypothetical protein